MIFKDKAIVGVSISITVIATAVALLVALQLPDRSGGRTFCFEGFMAPESRWWRPYWIPAFQTS